MLNFRNQKPLWPPACSRPLCWPRHQHTRQLGYLGLDAISMLSSKDDPMSSVMKFLMAQGEGDARRLFVTHLGKMQLLK